MSQVLTKSSPEWEMNNTALLSTAVTLMASILLFSLPPLDWENLRLESITDQLQGAIVLTMSLLLLLSQRLQMERDWTLTAVAYSFMVAASLRFLDGCTEIIGLSVWLNSLSALTKALCFLIVWVPPTSPAHRRSIALVASLFLGGGLGLLSFLFRDALPVTVIGREYSLFMKYVNVGIGILFLFAVFFRAVQVGSNGICKLLIICCIAWGFVSLVTPFILIWSPSWWLLQFLDLVPAILVAISLFVVYHRHIRNLRIETAKAISQLTRVNQELERYTSVAAHDLAEPLRLVSNYCQLVLRTTEHKLESKEREYLEAAINGSKRMLELVKSLLEYSRVGKQAQNWESVLCGHVLEQVLEDLELLIKENGAKVTSTPLPRIESDSTLLRQLFQNLITNAIKYRHAERTPEIRVSAKKNRNEWIFSVSDNGIGIPEDQIPKIFLMFQRLKTSKIYPGTGIGLATAKKIVDLLGGRIWATSVVGTGTTFFFSLPSHPEHL